VLYQFVGGFPQHRDASHVETANTTAATNSPTPRRREEETADDAALRGGKKKVGVLRLPNKTYAASKPLLARRCVLLLSRLARSEEGLVGTDESLLFFGVAIGVEVTQAFSPASRETKAAAHQRRCLARFGLSKDTKNVFGENEWRRPGVSSVFIGDKRRVPVEEAAARDAASCRQRVWFLARRTNDRSHDCPVKDLPQE
jgi:hypothetical protein